MRQVSKLIITFIILVVAGCKGGCPDYDYRSKWGGKWRIRSISHSTQHRDTTVFTGLVKCSSEGMVSITIANDETQSYLVSSDGKLTEPTQYYGHGEFIGNDSIQLIMYYGDLGTQSGRKIDGWR